ncbi:amino acid adenylation domain-containing protein [Bradyrhizobium sp. STM 3557]|uniref:amino acid adenylation domain-containing protein n=1 Tax=Bradyrhizobium sp. STM 3557 TaxID=578920 RepID=UPI0038905915
MLDRDDPAFNIGQCVEIDGAVDRRVFEQAVRLAVKDADALHLRFIDTESGPRQYYDLDEHWPLPFIDLSAEADSRAAAEAWMRADLARPFDLTGEQLFRIAMLRIEPDCCFCYLAGHHIICDSFGAGLFVRRIAELYASLATGCGPTASDLCSHDALLDAERAYANSEHHARDRAYWLKALEGHPEGGDLATRSAALGSSVHRIAGAITSKLDVEDFAQLRGLNPAAVLMAGVATYLYRMTGAADLTLGMQVSNRLGEKLRRTVGLATNVIPVRVSIDANESFEALSRKLARIMREGYRHQRYRWEELRRDLGLSGRNRAAFAALVNYVPIGDDIRFGEFGVRLRQLPNGREENIQFLYYGGSKAVTKHFYIVANSARYALSEAEAHHQRFCEMLAQCMAQPETASRDAVVLQAAERQRILYEWNATEAEHPTGQCIHELIEEQAAKTPDALAVAFEDAAITYAELNARANRLAHRLIAEGVKPDDRVAIAVERSTEMVVALLATLKAGGAYVPLDPTYPAERLQFMLRDSAPRVLLTQESILPRLGRPLSGTSVLTLDMGPEAWHGYSSENPDPRALGLTPSHLAYLIYTSGSTGAPKGVMVEHRSLQASTNARLRYYGGYDRVLLAASISFDSSVAAIFGALAVGGTLIVSSSEAALAPELTAGLLERWKITSILGVPSFLNALCERGSSEAAFELKQVVTGGEPCTSDLVEKVARWAPGATLYNEYGPTEATVWASVQRCAKCSLSGPVPIGRPIANTRIYILDAAGHPVPVGVVGEVHIGGAGVARGYLNQPDLTAERFLRDPFAEAARHPNARMYRTGDLARWLPDGTIAFLGRNDHQVKIRGFRVELGEVEARLSSHHGVQEAAVLAREDLPGGKRLVAYYTGAQGIAAADLRAHLALSLPDYMVPSAYVHMPALPLTPNGKLDRQALPAPDQATAFAVHSYEAPQGPIELALAAIWSELLQVERIGRHDDFFDLGGHSLLATQAAARIRRDFKIELPLRVLFECSTLERLGASVQEALGASEPGPLLPLIGEAHASDRAMRLAADDARDDQSVLSYSQQRMWLIQTLDTQNAAYNMSGVLRLTGRLDRSALAQAFDILRRRHENLRSVFFEEAGEVRQRTVPWQAEELAVIDLRSLGEGASVEALKRVEVDARTPFDLERGPVLRICLYRTADDEHLLQLNLHHISGDQWSMAVIGRELAALYNAIGKGEPLPLKPLHLHYRDYARWQRRYLEDRNQPALAYWIDRLKDVPALELPIDLPRPRLRSHNGAIHETPLSPGLLAELNALSRKEGSTLFMTMLAAFALQLYRLTGQQDFAIGVPIANRTQADVENMVGTFVNLLALRIDLSGNPSFQQLLQRVRSVALEAYTHQDVPFDKLVQEVQYPRDDRRAPLLQVMFNMPNVPFHGVSFDGLTWEPIIVDRGGAQFELSISVDTQLKPGVTIEYNTDLFQPATVGRFAAQYLQILQSILENPGDSINTAPILPPRERQLLLEEWNATGTADKDRPPFIAMFERQVARQPDAPAISFEGRTISYAELDAAARAIGQNLREAGVGRGTGVAILMNRSIDLVAILLGIQKVGAYYVPLDPVFPVKRLQYMLEDSGVGALVTDAGTMPRFDVPAAVAVLDSARLKTAAAATDRERLAACVVPSDVAYVIYTSGSTGQPKGVVIEHGALSNFLASMAHHPGLARDDVLLAVTTIAFDIAGLELYLPLSVGARVELAAKETAGSAEALKQLISDSQATVLQATPATWRMLLDSGWEGAPSLRAFCGGEALSKDLAGALLGRVAELWNLYGPTETTIWSTAARVEAGDADISIGTPIANTRIYITDRNGELTPIGIPGEILIGGDGLARGYHARPELTADRFVSDRFAGKGKRLYKTGDLGKWGIDGRLYHLGRIDNQVKIRGHRIEAGEIEALLRKHPLVAQAVVVAYPLTGGDVRLVAYVVSDTGVIGSELRSYLREALPEYMVPALIVAVDDIPLTPNGKIDRKALPDPFLRETEITDAFEQPAEGMESTLAQIWRELLKLQTISARDNFFELGGHSLLAVRLARLLEKRTGKRLDPRRLYFQNLRQIAEDLAGR